MSRTACWNWACSSHRSTSRRCSREADLGTRTYEPGARLLRGLIGIASLVAVLELASRATSVTAVSLPPPSAVLGRAVGLLVDPAFLLHAGATLVAWGVGLGCAVILAVPIGLGLGSSRRAQLAATAVIELLRPIPSVALIPPAILLLGRGLDMKVALVTYAALWPILVNTITGARAVDPVAVDTARAYGLSRTAILLRVVYPSAAPFAVTGVRISAAVALIVAISAELLAGGGLGVGTWMLGVSQAGVPRELLLGGVVLTGALGLVLNAALVAGERRLFTWRHAGSRAS